MSERVKTTFTNEHFAEYCKQMVGQPYWYGTCGYNCTESLRARKAKQYPSHYGSSRTSRYKQDISNKKVCCDCVGGSKGYAWTGGGAAMIAAIGTGKSITSKYASNNCPDKSADGMFTYAKNSGKNWGVISTIPEVVGLAVRYSGHVGYYIGNGKVVEWRGFKYGCVITELKKRSWTHWYELPFIDYSGSTSTESSDTKSILGTRLLKRGSKGEDVKELQELLNDLDFNAGTVDGDFGSNTEAAVKRMQTAANIEVDGKYGSNSHAALMDMVADANPEDDDDDEVVKKLVVTGSRVNIRVGAGTQYKIITVVKKGTELEYTAQASNGWYAVKVNGETGWISNKYSRPSDN